MAPTLSTNRIASSEPTLKIYVKMKDAFSGATDQKTFSFPSSKPEEFKAAYRKMKSSIGTFVNQFDKAAQIHYTGEILEVLLEHEV